ncbi:MAG: hypothetical protein K0Q72_4875 [Armatimonadetes bacterium]|nr:hypothetical protein [Armatimonadota bacterium]
MTLPGSLMVQSTWESFASIQPVRAARSAAVGCGEFLGGMWPALTFLPMCSQTSRALTTAASSL